MVFCFMKKAENFFKALQNLKEIKGKKPPYDTIATAGMVSLFEICFEQAWKAMKEQLELSGYGEHKSGSPKSVIKLAYQARMVKDEELWLAALRARNNVAQSCSEPIALSIIRDSQEKFVAMFEQLAEELRERWLWWKFDVYRNRHFYKHQTSIFIKMPILAKVRCRGKWHTRA